MNIKLIKTAVQALDDKKGIDIKVLKTEALTSLCSYFVICSGTSTTHIKALADECEYQLSQEGMKPDHREGKNDGGWILLDCGGVIIHIYTKQSRAFYDLERFWKDAEVIDINNLSEE